MGLNRFASGPSGTPTGMADSTASPYAPGRRRPPRVGTSASTSAAGASRTNTTPAPSEPGRRKRLGSTRRVGDMSDDFSPYRPNPLPPTGKPRSLAGAMHTRTESSTKARRPPIAKPWRRTQAAPGDGPPISLSDDDDEPQPLSDVSFDAARFASAGKILKFPSSEDEGLSSDITMVKDKDGNMNRDHKGKSMSKGQDRGSPTHKGETSVDRSHRPHDIGLATNGKNESPVAVQDTSPSMRPPLRPQTIRRLPAPRRRQSGIKLPLTGMTIREVLVWHAPKEVKRKTGFMTLQPNRRILLAPVPLDQNDAWPICPCDVQTIKIVRLSASNCV